MKGQTTLPGEATPVGPIMPSSSNGSIDTASLELLASWRTQDATKSPQELQAADKEIAEFKAAMNDNRARSGEPLLYP